MLKAVNQDLFIEVTGLRIPGDKWIVLIQKVLLMKSSSRIYYMLNQKCNP